MSFVKYERSLLLVSAVAILATVSTFAQPIATSDLEIRGMALTIDNPSVSTVPDTPSYVQTRFGGQINDDAPVLEDVLVRGDLIGPGVAAPITIQTAAGHRFQIPGLASPGTYFLQNIRLERAGKFLQPAIPSFVVIKVADAFKTEVTVKQLTPDQLRQRGINVDARNYDVYEYTLAVVIDGQTVTIPFPVIIDSRTHEVIPVPRETPFQLPADKGTTPPRWSPPSTILFDLPPADTAETPTPPSDPPDGEATVRPRPSIPVAIVIPSDFAVLHQFFAVALMVTNGGSGDVKLDSVTASIQPPAELRVAGSTPPVAFGQPITIVDKDTGSRFLIAKAQGSAEWSMEALKSGTYEVKFDIRATFQSPGQPDIPLRATPKAALVVHDPSFNVTFSHPDTVRKDEPYTTFAFITNMGSTTQSLVVDSGVQNCTENPSANVCLDGGQASTSFAIDPGETYTLEYKLRPNVTGQVFATAASSDGDVIKTGVKLTMGVSATGIPLSPATLVMPYYARFLPESLIRGNLRLLGLGYSLATAPPNQHTASFPRVIRSDVFRRAVDIARAGQRIFISEDRDREGALANLALDLLGNGDGNDLLEWDELRRLNGEAAGPVAGASLAREMEASVPASDRTLKHLFDTFASTTSHRPSYLAVLAHGAAVANTTQPYSIVVCPRASNGLCQGQIAIPNEVQAGLKRSAAWGDLCALSLTDPNAPDPQHAPVLEVGQLALVGRATTDFQVEVTAAKVGNFDVELIWPGAAATDKLKATMALSATSDKQKFVLYLHKGDPTVTGDAIATGALVPLAALEIVGARQDMHLEEDGHLVSLLFNRPVRIATDAVGNQLDVRGAFDARVSLNLDGVQYNGERPIYGAALQEDARVLNLTFEHALSQNASYNLSRRNDVSPAPLVDAASGAPVAFAQTSLKVENDRSAAILTGQVLGADGLPIAGAEVTLRYASGGRPAAPQVDLSDASGKYFYEYVPLDPNNGYPGTYRLEGVAKINGTNKLTFVDGAVRAPRHVHYVNLSFLGRGIAEGHVRYDDGAPVTDARVVVGNTMFGSSRETRTDGTGSYRVSDLPVGPLTFSAIDASGNIAFAANELKSGGQTIAQDISIYRRPFPGLGRVRGVVRRSDSGEPVAGAQVGAFAQGYAVASGLTDDQGRFDFAGIPSGFVTVLAAEWSVSRQSAAVDFDLGADQIHDVDLMLQVVAAGTRLVRIHGVVLRQDPLDPTKADPVANAVVKIEKSTTVLADANGNYAFEAVPDTMTGRLITAYDPLTSRSGSVSLDLSNSGTTDFNVPISIANQYGTGTVRVLLLDAAGRAVTAPYIVLEPGYPAVYFESKGNGTFELADAPVGATVSFVAVPANPPDGAADTRPYGDQYATGSARIGFAGHMASVTVRLPGEGRVRVGYEAPTDPNQALATGPVTIGYRVWNHAEQDFAVRYRDANTGSDGTGFATFTKVPALQGVSVEAYHPILGYAHDSAMLAFDGDIRTVTLKAAKLSTIHGSVYAIDGKTPVAGATVRLSDGRVDRGTYVTNPDGSFEFAAVAAGLSFDIIASVTQAGTYRTGIASGRTPDAGGPVDGIAVFLQKQGSITIRVKKADGSPLPLAKLWVHELAFPNRSFGTPDEPLTADLNGQIVRSNVFVGSVRVSAYDPNNPDLRGDATGVVDDEGATRSIDVTVGGLGTGTIEAVVIDPNTAQSDPVANAEVALMTGDAIYDLATTDLDGSVRFVDVPAGREYSLSAYSKLIARGGSSARFPLGNLEDHLERILLELSGEVLGTLRDNEKPSGQTSTVPGAQVTLYASSYQTRATTATDGTYHFLGIREGDFRLEARDPLSWRTATATGRVSAVDTKPTVDLELEPTSTIKTSIWLPNDDGSRSNTLTGAVSYEVGQLCYSAPGGVVCDMKRASQTNGAVSPGWLREKPIRVVAREIGGEGREVIDESHTIGASDASIDIDLVLPAYGTVRVSVTQSSGPAANAQVTLGSATLYTGTDGIAVFTHVRLGVVAVQARSFDGRLTAYATSTLASQSVSLIMPLDLGSYATIHGVVFAETGGLSVGTRVVASIGGTHVEQLTGADGTYTFGGIPATASGTAVSFDYFGSDGETRGALWSRQVTSADAEKTIEAPPVTLDATAPQLVSIDPVDGAQNVSPDAHVRLEFSEQIAFNAGNFHVTEVDGNVAVPVSATHSLLPSGASVVELTPSRPLASQKLHQILVDGTVTDLSGHALPATRGATFITTDYAGPQIVKIVPAEALPMAPNSRFEIHFNEPIQRSGIAVVLRKGGVATEPDLIDDAMVQIDETGTMMSFAPRSLLETDSSYVLVLAGVKDLQNNPLRSQEESHTFYTYDTSVPVLQLESPVSPDSPLIERTSYSVSTVVKNPNGTDATDIARVEFVRKDMTSAAKDDRAPFQYVFVAPEVGPNGTNSVTLEATAYDTSGNPSNTASMTWAVTKDGPPRDVVVQLTPAGAFYPGTQIGIDVTYYDEAPESITPKLVILGTRQDGSSWDQTLTKSSATVVEPRHLVFNVTVPRDLRSQSEITFTATITDIAGQPGSGQARTTVAADTVAPQVTILEPAPDTQFDEGSTITVRATAVDAEVGVADVSATIEGQTVVQLARVAGTDEYRGIVTAPTVAGSDFISKSVIVSARDYAPNTGSATVPVRIKSLFDPNRPVISILCPTAGGLYPVGYAAKVRVDAVKGSGAGATNIQKVEISAGGASVQASLVSGSTSLYEAVVPMAGTAGAVVTISAVVTTLGGSSADANTQVELVQGNIIVSDTTISTTSYDGSTLIIQGGTTTLVGTHTFADIVVLDGAKLTHASGSTEGMRLTSSRTFVSCNGSIDVTGRGYGASTTYPNTAPSTGSSGGVHIGTSGADGGASGSVYGSVYQPQEAGAGAGYASSGGGVVRIVSGTTQIDGSIRANGDVTNGRSGAGGGVWITTTDIGGSGVIEARGGDGFNAGGGGGAIAIEYRGTSHGTLLSAGLLARGGKGNDANGKPNGGAGTVYVKGPLSTYGDLVIDNKAMTGTSMTTQFPSLGSGAAQSGTGGATLVTSVDVPPYFVGHWVEIIDAGGNVKGTWRIESIDTTNKRKITLAANGTPLNVQENDRWRGVYRFDTLSAIHGESFMSADPIRIGVNGIVPLVGPTTPGQFLNLTDPIIATSVTITGNVSVPSITAQMLTVNGGATLTAPMNTTTPNSLTLNISGTFTLASSATIDVTGRGYGANNTYPDATPSTGSSGGAHIGTSGADGGGTPGAAYGSIYRPQEAGAGAGDSSCGGGGIVRIVSGTAQIDGTIRANGAVTSNRSGAGGSVWITTTNLKGDGVIEARGGDGFNAGGGGGAIAIEYSGTSSGTLVSSGLLARGGKGNDANNKTNGGSGTVYLKGPDSTYGDVVIDNKAMTGTSVGTQFPSLGGGTAQQGSNGATLVTNRYANIPAYFGGHWVEIRTPDGKVIKGTWRIESIDANDGKIITLRPGSGETINLEPGDLWQGVYRFDTLRAVHGEAFISADPLQIGINGVVPLAGPTAPGQYLDLADPITATSVTITGNVSVPSITAQMLTINGGATLTVPTNTTTPNALTLNISGTFTLASGATIDVTGRGYGANTTYPEAIPSTGSSGGAHIGTSGGDGGGTPGTVYGSIYRPQEAGAGAGDASCGGGGIVRIVSGTAQIDGVIKANGTIAGGWNRSGAGGSVWITTTNLKGDGVIEARGGDGFYAGGGGGAIAIEYSGTSSGTLVSSGLLARGGKGNDANGKPNGGAGTVYVKGPLSTYGDVVIDNKAMTGTSMPTQFPSLGSGTAQMGTSGATLMTNAEVPAYFVGHWIEIFDSGNVKGTWRIESIDASDRKKMTLASSGSPVNVLVNDRWQGVYRFDHPPTKINNVDLQSIDPIRTLFASAGFTDDKNVTVAIDDGQRFLFSTNTEPPVIDQDRIEVIETDAEDEWMIHIPGSALRDPDGISSVAVSDGIAIVEATRTPAGDFEAKWHSRAERALSVRVFDAHPGIRRGAEALIGHIATSSDPRN